MAKKRYPFLNSNSLSSVARDILCGREIEEKIREKKGSRLFGQKISKARGSKIGAAVSTLAYNIIMSYCLKI